MKGLRLSPAMQGLLKGFFAFNFSFATREQFLQPVCRSQKFGYCQDPDMGNHAITCVKTVVA